MNKIGIITGAAGGIGSAIAKKFISHLDGLVLIDINEIKLNELTEQLTAISNIPIFSYYCDVGSSHSVESVLKMTQSEIGTPNIVINNAGIGGPFHRIDEVSDEEWFQIINTNLKGVFNLTRFLLPLMKKHHYGKIINIASVQGYLGAAQSSTYVASKHGVIGYTRAIAAEWGEYGINCNAICPGYVNTTMGIQPDHINHHMENVIQKTPMKRVDLPEEIANLVVYLIKDESSFINGAIVTIDGGLTCHVGVS